MSWLEQLAHRAELGELVVDLRRIAHPSAIAECPAVLRGTDGSKGCAHVASHDAEVTRAVLSTELFIIHSYCCHASNLVHAMRSICMSAVRVPLGTVPVLGTCTRVTGTCIQTYVLGYLR